MNKSSKKFGNFLDFNSPFPCDQHPFSSHDVGICPHCLNDRLMILVCSDCGERRLSSCSCSDLHRRRNSCSTTARNHHTKPRPSTSTSTSLRLWRSNSTSTRLDKSSSNGFARIKRLFFINKQPFQNLEICDDENISNQYIGGGYDYEARKTSQNQMDQSDRFCSRTVFPAAMDDDSDTDTETAFIDLNLHSFSYECNQETQLCGGRSSIASDHPSIYRNEINFHTSKSNGISANGGSCRFTIDERGFKQQGTSRNYKFWKWIFNNRAKK